MKEKPNEWVSIADLMAGVMAVVMLLLVISVIQRGYSDAKSKKELEASHQEQGRLKHEMENVIQDRKNSVGIMLKEMHDSISRQGAENLVSFDMTEGKITLRDNVFAKGSACITPEAKAAFSSVEKNISSFLGNMSDGKIFVEGHTDSIPVSRPVIDFVKFCTVYDDNYTLSAARAREARNLLIGNLAAENAKRIVVAGYGDSHPIAGIDPADARNRRVEVRFVINQDEK